MSRTLETRNKERVEGKPVVVELSDNLNPSRKTTVFCSKSYGCHVSICSRACMMPVPPPRPGREFRRKIVLERIGMYDHHRHSSGLRPSVGMNFIYSKVQRQ